MTTAGRGGLFDRGAASAGDEAWLRAMPDTEAAVHQGATSQVIRDAAVMLMAPGTGRGGGRAQRNRPL